MKLIGSLLLALGGVQMGWAFHVIGDASLHMGSPLRILGPRVARNGGELRGEIQSVIELGNLGFALLSTTTWLMACCGLVTIGAGLYLIFRGKFLRGSEG